ncbi:MAG TPA: alginate lyase family protein [bacterium]|nr:alginate lyase family protein [bacterium]
MKLQDAARYLRTINRLKANQLYWRPRYMLEKIFSPSPLPSPPPEISESAIAPLGARFPPMPLFLRPGPVGEECVAMLDRGEFRHLNRASNINQDRPDWRLGDQDEHRLWINTLHYHYWIYDLAEAAAPAAPSSAAAAGLLAHYLTDWIRRCALEAPGSRHLVWNSYVIATRLTWWIRALLALQASGVPFPPGLSQTMLTSLWRQAYYLNDHVEWDLRANHVLRDAAGLAWAGRFFPGNDARDWLASAARIATAEVPEQVLPDGGHFERSPMYHLHVMEDVLSLALLLENADARAAMIEAWKKMAGFLRWIVHPDGGIALFNDSAMNGSAGPARMLSLGNAIGAAVAPGPPAGGRLFPDTGLVVWRGVPWTVFFDVGPVGPDYQPGHAHADTLSIECSFRGSRLFVDPGTYAYDHDARRDYDRSTAAHNTVCIDGDDSSEVWHIFRVGRRARPLKVSAEIASGAMSASASHDGYDHRPGRPRHARTLSITADGVLTVSDEITGAGTHEVSGGFLLAPGWGAEPAPSGWKLCNGPLRVHVGLQGPPEMKLRLEQRPYHPEYGLELAAARIGWSVDAPLPVTVRAVISEE